jgi:hypothetical protein
MNWKRGLNFSQARYKEVRNNSFIPYIRTGFRASLPRNIVERFDLRTHSNLVALLEISDEKNHKKVLRIKKLYTQGNSLTFSLKAERTYRPIIKVIDIASEIEALSRKVKASKHHIETLSLIPKYTNNDKNGTPIYSFKYGNKLIVGGYYKKDLRVENKIELNECNLSAIGLYFADGGKTEPSFTNSHPVAINKVLDFIENVFNIEREDVKAIIYCNPKLKNKKQRLEEFWNSQTGIENFADKLHFGKNSRSYCGTLELYFCRKTVKEIIIAVVDTLLNYEFDKKPVIRGILSGDGSPVQQTKYNLTHHLSFDKKVKSWSFIKNIFSDYKIKIIPTQPKATIYTTWEENKKLVFLDPYRFNLANRVRFAFKFLNLPRSLESNDKGIRQFKKTNYPRIFNDFVDFYGKMMEFELVEETIFEGVKNEYALC